MTGLFHAVSYTGNAEPPLVVDWAAGVATLVSDFGWSLSAKDTPMTLWHLANNVSGYGLDEAPGEAWAYNDFGIRLYAETLKLIYGGGDTALDTAAVARLADLGLQDASGGIFTVRSGCGVSLSPRDYARIALWWMRQGEWSGTQLLPADWFTGHFTLPQVDEALPRTTGVNAGDYLSVGTVGGTAPSGFDQNNDGQGHYGYNLWHNGLRAGVRFWPDLPSDAYGCFGHDGIECVVVIPSLELIVSAIGVGTWGSFSGSLNANVGAFVDGITGDPSYAAEFPGTSWTTATDGQAGLGTSATNTLVSTIGGSGVIVRRGRQVRAWGSSTVANDWASAAKPMLSTLLAFAIYEGLL